MLFVSDSGIVYGTTDEAVGIAPEIKAAADAEDARMERMERQYESYLRRAKLDEHCCGDPGDCASKCGVA